MICANCEKRYITWDSAYVMRQKPTPITFCCYQCYLDFWAGVKSFVPLPEYRKETR